MAQISTDTLNFLAALKANNNRDWFQKNKNRYQAAKDDVEAFIDALIGRISHFDPSVAHLRAKDRMFRIYRDIRFSKDKSPYKTHFGAHITAAVKRSDIHAHAGYYFHIGPGESMLAGGAYMPEASWLKAIRQEIDLNASGLKSVIEAPAFRKYFGELEGEKLKTAPRDYPKDHPEIELLRFKSFLAVHHCSDEVVLSDQYLDHCTEVYRAVLPLDEFLNRVKQA